MYKDLRITPRQQVFKCNDLNFQFITNGEMPKKLSVGAGLQHSSVMKQIVSKKAKLENPLLPNIVQKRDKNNSVISAKATNKSPEEFEDATTLPIKVSPCDPK
jgi:hypothetical protein